MKLKSLIFGIAVLAVAVACAPENPDATPKLEVNKASVSLKAKDALGSFVITTNQDWTASADASWVTIHPAFGEASSKPVSIGLTAEDNASEEARTATITLTAGSLTETISVTQAGSPSEGNPGEDPG
ncbi:MAG: BACON domain-containing protein, partial [Bacteroidales bacterium]|nr:BACON domain-containing protein [Bacteroidales bacterium]